MPPRRSSALRHKAMTPTFRAGAIHVQVPATSANLGPGFDALGSYGDVIKSAKRTLNGFTGGASAVNTIVVAPGKWASADVEWMNFNPTTGGDCVWSSSIATTPANTGDTHYFPVSVSTCHLQIHPTVKGKTGNG